MTDKADLNKLLDDWRDPYGARTVTLASDLIDALLRERHNFVEQACGAVTKRLKRATAVPDWARKIIEEEAKEKIMDKFK